MSFEYPVRVYIEDTDIGGIVYYVNYLKFMERARTEFLRSFSIEQQDLKAAGYLFVVKSVECDYKLSAKLDDKLVVSVEIDSHSGASVKFKQQVCHEQVVLCEALVEVVCVSATKMKPARFPAQVKKAFIGSI